MKNLIILLTLTIPVLISSGNTATTTNLSEVIISESQTNSPVCSEQVSSSEEMVGPTYTNAYLLHGVWVCAFDCTSGMCCKVEIIIMPV